LAGLNLEDLGAGILACFTDEWLRAQPVGIFSNQLGQSERAHETFDGSGVVAGETQFFVDLTVLHGHWQYHDSPT
jgi:hypothetical protein